MRACCPFLKRLARLAANRPRHKSDLPSDGKSLDGTVLYGALIHPFRLYKQYKILGLSSITGKTQNGATAPEGQTCYVVEAHSSLLPSLRK